MRGGSPEPCPQPFSQCLVRSRRLPQGRQAPCACDNDLPGSGDRVVHEFVPLDRAESVIPPARYKGWPRDATQCPALVLRPGPDRAQMLLEDLRPEGFRHLHAELQPGPPGRTARSVFAGPWSHAQALIQLPSPGSNRCRHFRFSEIPAMQSCSLRRHLSPFAIRQNECPFKKAEDAHPTWPFRVAAQQIRARRGHRRGSSRSGFCGSRASCELLAARGHARAGALADSEGLDAAKSRNGLATLAATACKALRPTLATATDNCPCDRPACARSCRGLVGGDLCYSSWSKGFSMRAAMSSRKAAASESASRDSAKASVRPYPVAPLATHNVKPAPAGV